MQVATNNASAAHGAAKQGSGDFVYRSVSKALQFTFETIASEGIKGAGYQEPTSASTVTSKFSQHDRHAMAAWTQQTAQNALSAVQWAWVTCTYDGRGDARHDALDVLTKALGKLHKNADLLRAVIDREFSMGETWCQSTPALARQTGASQPTVWRLAQKVELALSDLADEVSALLQAAFHAKGYLRAAH